MPVIPPILTFLLPFATCILSAWLTHYRLSMWWNSLIVLIVTFISSFVWALFASPITRSFWTDVLVIASYCLAMGAWPLAPLYRRLMELLPSPLAIFLPPIRRSMQKSRVSRAVGWRAAAHIWMPQGKRVVPLEDEKILHPPEETPPS